MPYIQTVDPAEATGDVQRMYEKDRRQKGYVPNYALVFSLRPDVMDAWGNLIGAISGHMDRRRYELVTIAAAKALTSSYCMLAHGKVLHDNFYSADQLEAIAADYHTADLTPAEVAMMAFAEQIVRDATAITQADVDGLRAHGFSDADIFDIVTTATARCFFSKTLDALGVSADSLFQALEPELRESLTVGRPIAE